MKNPLWVLGTIFTLVGTPFIMIGLSWIKFTSDSQAESGFEFLIAPLIFCLMGLIFSSIGVGIILNQRRLRLKRKMLMQTGRKIRGTIVSIAKNRNIRVNKRHPHIIICTASLSGAERKFKSNNVYGSLLINKGDELDIYVDFRDHDNYWVEVPEKATMR